MITLTAAALALEMPMRRANRWDAWVSPGGRRIITGRKDFYRRAVLPYGRWLCRGERVVLFNRFYEPIWQRVGASVTRADPQEWVPWEKQEYFYDDSVRDADKLRLALVALDAFGGP